MTHDAQSSQSIGGVDRPETPVDGPVCRLCGALGPRIEEAADIPSFTSVPGRFRITRCAGCGLLRTEPILTPDELQRHYERFGPHACAPDSAAALARLAAIRDRKPTAAVLKFLYRRRRAPVSVCFGRTGRLLDVGCGSGSFLVRAAALGWDVHGQDVYPAAGKLAQDCGLPVWIGPLAQMPADYDGSFDLVTAWHVVEHMDDPRGAVERMYQLLRPGGALVVEVPNAGSWERKWFGAQWNLWMPPLHLHHFDRRTLARLLESAGFIDLRLEAWDSHAGQSLSDGIPGPIRRGASHIGRMLSPLLGQGSVLRAYAHRDARCAEASG